MDALELEYETLEAVPEAFRPLYTETDGKFLLGNINGLKTTKDTDALGEALRKERVDHGKARDGLKLWHGMDHAEVQIKLDRIPELELAAEGKMDDEKIGQLVDSRIAQKTGPLQRQIDQLTTERDGFQSERDVLQGQASRRDMTDAVRVVALEMKVVPTALLDVDMVAASYLERDDAGMWIVRADSQSMTPGLDIKGFMKEMMKVRPHWWPASAGGGAGGGGAQFGGQVNPWAHDKWHMTEQAKVFREQGREVADRMAKAAGTTVGGLQPKAPKT